MSNMHVNNTVLERIGYVRLTYLIITVFSIPNILIKEKGILSIIFTAMLIIILIAKNFLIKNGPFHLYLFISFIALISDVSYMSGSEYKSSSFMHLIADALHFIFTLSVLYLISREIFQKKKITKDAIAGGICIYLLLGNLWSLIYENIYMLDNGAFHASSGAMSSFDFLFFSFTTFTTTGYGNIVPVSIAAKSFTIVETVVGVMLPAVFISRLVGLYGMSKNLTTEKANE